MTLGARRQSTSNYCSVTLLTQRVNSLHIELKLIKTVYSASIPLTSLLKTRNSSSSFQGLINALDQEQYHTLTFRDFQSVNERRETEPGRHGGWLGGSPHGLLTCPGEVGLFCSAWAEIPPQRERGTALARELRNREHRDTVCAEPRSSQDFDSWCKTAQWGHHVRTGATMGPDLLVTWGGYWGFTSKRHSSLVTVFWLKRNKTKKPKPQTSRLQLNLKSKQCMC